MEMSKVIATLTEEELNEHKSNQRAIKMLGHSIYILTKEIERIRNDEIAFWYNTGIKYGFPNGSMQIDDETGEVRIYNHE